MEYWSIGVMEYWEDGMNDGIVEEWKRKADRRHESRAMED
jgi:hypothetical protein